MKDVSLYPRAHNPGWIEVICGCMFSGKTEELIRRLRRAQIARQNVLIFKPRIDNRYGSDRIVSHNTQSLDSIVIGKAKEIMELSVNAQVIGIDEVQFFLVIWLKYVIYWQTMENE